MKILVSIEPVDFRKGIDGLVSSEIETVPIDRFELERLIGDICISINDMEGGPLQHQLLDLCNRLEAAEKHGHGSLDEF